MVGLGISGLKFPKTSGSVLQEMSIMASVVCFRASGARFRCFRATQTLTHRPGLLAAAHPLRVKTKHSPVVVNL